MLAQEEKIDSLRDITESQQPAVIKLKAWQELAELLVKKDTVSADAAIQAGISLARELQDDEAELDLALIRAVIASNASDYDKALELSKTVAMQAEERGYRLLTGEAYLQMGWALYMKEDSTALSCYQRSLEAFEEEADKKGIARIYMYIGVFHKRQYKYDSALFFLEKSAALYEKIDLKKEYGKILIHMANIHLTLGDDLELVCAKRAHVVFKEIGEKALEARMLTRMARYHADKQNYLKAFPLVEESLEIMDSIQNKKGIETCNSLLAWLYNSTGDFDRAIAYANKVIDAADKTNNTALTEAYGLIGIIRQKQGDYRAAIDGYQKAVQLMSELSDKSYQIRGLVSIGVCFLEDLSQEDSARAYFDKAVAICLETNYSRGFRYTLEKFGDAYARMGQLPKALDLYFSALQFAERQQGVVGMGAIHEGLASIYVMQKNFPEALNHQQLALESYLKEQDFSHIARAKNRMADLYINSGEYQQAFDHAMQGLVAFQEMQDTCSFSPAYLTMGTASASLQQPEAARLYLQDGLRYAEKCGKSSDIARAAIALGQVYQTEQKQAQTTALFERALASAQNSKERELIKEAAGLLYPYYQQRGLYEKAFETLNLYQANKDSLFNEANTRTLVQKEMEYAYAQEQQEAAMERQQAEAAQQRVLDRQKWLTYMFIGGFVAALLIALAVYRNFRNKQKANILLRKQKAELEELDHLKSRLFANISHELRTPLTLISSPVESLLHEPQGLNAQARAKLDLVQRNSQQLRSLVDDILDLSKLESNRVEVHEEPTAIAPFLRRVFSNFESLASHLGINYAEVISGLDDAWLQVDAGKVEKILNNLLSNAVKHTPSGGLVRLLASKTEGRLQLRVEDTGQGIAAADLPHIFDRFFQSKQPDAPIQGGTGIGLALARELVQLMGGSISVESEVGKGSCFTVLLPWQEVAAQEQAPESTEVQETENISLAHLQLSDVPDAEKRFTVLVVEDHPDMQQFVSGLLRMRYKVKLAGNGKEALDILAREHIDLIVTDVMMPEMDGYTLLQHLKAAADLRAIPVIMLTALDSEDKKLDALTLGVDDYLTKPFSPEELLARTYNLLLRYEARQEEARLSPDHATAPDTPTRAVESPAPAPQERAASSSPAAVAQELEVLETSESEAAWLQEVAEEIRKELENPDFQLNDLADRLLLSEQQFYRKMKKITGLPPKKYQQEVALQEARKLLEKGAYGNVTAICFSVGMSNVSRFSQLYEARFGKKPKAYFK